MEGSLVYESGYWKVSGKWKLAWDDKQSSRFEWRSTEYTPNDRVRMRTRRAALPTLLTLTAQCL